ncbi:uncharacterized protein FIBRA_06655 [Fibroporia radiculosa]|uniref:FAD dependent oxidoreductase domain-containing protein n=1 Tax=Fibroporia radiculosa TaxID=599839 RepID=J4GT62_9APHY|nr:uncharacterized protein FIBRA_06655 [Fibroporia radiculosa]CCM04475.1 predicted protein [Fibroporia radiculosa]
MAETGPVSAPTQVVILGGGVIGLTIAHVLSASTQGEYSITIVARDMPSDLESQSFASPWAGANWSPIGGYDECTYRREIVTFNKLWSLIPTGMVMASSHAMQIMIILHLSQQQALPFRVYYETAEGLDKLWYRNLVRDFRVMDAAELISGAKGGVYFNTVSLNPELYLPWLAAELNARGVRFVKQRMQSLSQAAALAGAGGIVVNATALGARSLIGVEDLNVYPIRGQTIIVHAPSIKECAAFPLESKSSDPSRGEATYMIPRPYPVGHVLLGGTYQPDNWETATDFSIAQGILKRCAAFAPELASKDLRILKHNVGLRPARKGGPRIEVEWRNLPIKDAFATVIAPPFTPSRQGRIMVVHAYGFGPAGYQNSWGAAEEVASLICSNFDSMEARL